MESKREYSSLRSVRVRCGKIIQKIAFMPIFFQQDIDGSTKFAIWKIEEPESFFLSQVPLQRNITHPHKRLQHLAGRYLMKYLFPEFPLSLIRIADTRKPFLEDEAYHFSISHCGDYAAVIISTENRVGIDIEEPSYKVQRIRHKFLSSEDAAIFQNKEANELTFLTLAWSCKEAVFKWYGKGEVDFRKHIHLKRFEKLEGNDFSVEIKFTKEQECQLEVDGKLFKNICLSYLVTRPHIDIYY